MGSEETPTAVKKPVDFFMLLDKVRKYNPVLLPMLAVFVMRWILAPSTHTTIVLKDCVN